jgi:DNA-binding NarL/FixJ family response regulator
MPANGGPAIRVLIVDDHTLFRKGAHTLLAGEEAFEVVGEASGGREALERAQDLMPDLILMDVSMPEGNGLEATRRIKEALPYVRIVMLTVSEDEQHLFEAIKSGADGYLVKSIDVDGLIAALRGVMHGQAPMSHTMASKILGEFARMASGRPTDVPARTLTPREHDVLELLTQGKTNKEIAAILTVAENTVKNHLRNILEKLHLENRVQAATFAVRKGLVARHPPSEPAPLV